MSKIAKKVSAFFKYIRKPETKAKAASVIKSTQKFTQNMGRGIEETLPRPRPTNQYSLTKNHRQPDLGRVVVRRPRY